MRDNNNAWITNESGTTAASGNSTGFGDVVASQTIHVWDYLNGPGQNMPVLTTITNKGVLGIIRRDSGPHTLRDATPDNVNYGSITGQICTLFPLLARQTVAATIASTRQTERAYVKYFDNTHYGRIIWPTIVTADNPTGHLLDYVIIDQCCFYIPDIATAEVLTPATANLAAEVVRAQKLYQWYNSHCMKTPIADALVTANVPASAVDNNNWEDFLSLSNFNVSTKKEFLADGVTDRKKECRLVWRKWKRYNRPKRMEVETHGASAVEEGLPIVHQWVKLGKKFKLNRTFVYEKAGAAPRNIIPRGVYVYATYMWVCCPQAATAMNDADDLPILHIGPTPKSLRNGMLWQQG